MTNYQWFWKGKAIPLEKLHSAQLNSIQNTLIKNKGSVWFNIPSSDWRKEIKKELDKRKAFEISNRTLSTLNNYNSCLRKILHKR